MRRIEKLFSSQHPKSLVVLASTLAVFLIFFFRFLQINKIGLSNHNDALLYYSFDGTFHITRLMMSSLWTLPNLSLDLNTILANGGNISSINDLLIPQHFFVHIFPSLFSPVTLIFLFMIEVFAAVYFFFRVVEIPRWISFFAAWLTCVFNFPLVITPLVKFGFFSTPHMAHVFSLGLVLLACFWRIGKGGWRQNLLMVLVLAVVGFIILISSPHRAPLLSVFLITVGPFIWLYAPRREYLPKLLFTLISLVLIFLTGIFDVYQQVELMYNFPEQKHTSMSMLAIETAKSIFVPDFQNLSKLFTNDASAPALAKPEAKALVRMVQFLALVSAIYGVIHFPSRSERMVSAIAVLFTWYLANNQSDFGGRIFFIESHAWPFLGASLGLGIREAVKSIQYKTNWMDKIPVTLNLSTGKVAYSLIILISMSLFLTTTESPRGYAYPLKHNKVTKFLKDRIGVSPGDEFKGNYASTVGWHEGKAVNEEGQHWVDVTARFDYGVLRRTGGDIRTGASMFFNLPIIHSNYSLNHPFYLMIYYRDPFSNDVMPVYPKSVFQQKTGMLWLMGNRYLVTDEELPFAVALEMPVEDIGTVRVYDLGGANTGYSPAQATGYEDWSEYLDSIMAGELDPRLVTGVEPKYAGAYQQANNIKYTLERGGIRVRASSSGRSMVVVPFNYSACLIPRVQKGRDVIVTRANMINTAIIFENEVDIWLDFRFGPFENRNCLRKDMDFARKTLKLEGQ